MLNTNTHMYDVKGMSKLEKDLQKSIRNHFVEFFSNHDYSKDCRSVVSKLVLEQSDAEKIYYGVGMYVIMSDYLINKNECQLTADGLKAIYRGQCYTVKSRLKSHLFNDHYRRNLPERGVRYDVCIKLDDNNGINIDQPPYNQYRWKVIVHKMKGSTKLIREQAELAFDDVFGRPLGSKEVG